MNKLEGLFNRFMSAKHEVQDLASIVQNSGTTVTNEEIKQWDLRFQEHLAEMRSLHNSVLEHYAERNDEKLKQNRRTRIIRNRIKCNHCGQIIESVTRHDFKTCKCESVSVDGGKDYLRRSFKEKGDYEDLSETVEVPQ